MDAKAADATPVAAAGEAAEVKVEAPVVEEVAKLAEADKVSEKAPETPATPATEPLTNGSSAPESPKEEIRQNGDAASVEEQPPQPEPVPEVEVAEPAKAEEKAPPSVEDLPINGLSLQEAVLEVAPPAAEVPEVPEPVAEVIKCEVGEKVAAVPEAIVPETVEEKSPAIAEAEVCVAKESSEVTASSDVAPPPLPASPPPSSLTMFAESTMAPPALVDPPVDIPVDTPVVAPVDTPPAKDGSEELSLAEDEKNKPCTASKQEELVCEIPSDNLSTALPNVIASGEDLPSSPSAAKETSAEPPSESNTPSVVSADTKKDESANVTPSVDNIAVVPSDEIAKPTPSESVSPQVSPISEVTPPPSEVIVDKSNVQEAVEVKSPLPVDPVAPVSVPEPSPEPKEEPTPELSSPEPIICICPMQPPVVEPLVVESEATVSLTPVTESIDSAVAPTSELPPAVDSAVAQVPTPIEPLEALPLDESPAPVVSAADSPVSQKELDISDATLAEPPSESFPPPPPPESCPESMTELSMSESLPPPLSECSIPDTVLNSPTSETVELPPKDQASPVDVQVADVKESLELDAAPNVETKVAPPSQSDITIPPPAEIVAAPAEVSSPEPQQPSETPQVKSVSEVTEAPAVTSEVTATETAPSVDAAAE